MLDEAQKNIIENSKMKAVIIASAGSGKTEVLTKRVEYLLNSGVDPKEMAIITFTNLASEEMSQRINFNGDLPYIGTIHGFANQNLLKNKIDTSKLLNDEKYDELLKLAIKHSYVFNGYNYILWDEVQDSGPLEFKLIMEAIDPDSFFVVGDPRQSIYGFKGGDPALLMSLTKREDVSVYYLNNNYRCGYNILNYAKGIIKPTGLEDFSYCTSQREGSVIEAKYSLDTIVKYVNKDEYKDWAILTRTNADLNTIKANLETNGIPCISFKQKDLTQKDLSEALNNNAVKVLTVHSAKGMAFNNVIVVGMRFYPREERNICYVAATRAKENLVWMKSAKKKKEQPKVKMFQW